MRKKVIFAAVIFQFLVLFFICGKRERIIRFGDPVYLRTAPVDPRDLFRGDFVRLSYEISNVPVIKLKGIDVKELRRGMVLYAALREHDGGLAEMLYLSPDAPEEGLFIKGWCNTDPKYMGDVLQMRYGIESYYVQQGRGLEMEDRLAGRERSTTQKEPQVQNPMEVRIALGGDGTAVIDRHRWSPLGHDISIYWNNDPAGRLRSVVSVRYSIRNTSEKLIALVHLPGYGSFSVEPQGFTGGFRNNDEPALIPQPLIPSVITPGNEHVIVLRPRETRIFTFDFTDPKLSFKTQKGKTVSMGAFSPSLLFRIVYRAPSREACRNLAKKDLIWHGYLPSRAFSGSGFID